MATSPSLSKIKSTTVRSLAWQAFRAVLRSLSRAAPRLMASWFDRRFLSTRRRPRPAWERDALARAEPFTFDCDGRRLPAWSWGSGPLVLLVHGWDGWGSQLAAFARPLAAAGYRVVTFDAPGHGEAEGRSSSLPEMEAALRALTRGVASRGWGPVRTIIAHSAGTVVVQHAVRHGLAVDRLVFLAPPADMPGMALSMGHALGLTAEVVGLTRRRIESRFSIDWDEFRSAAHAHRATVPLLVLHDRDDRMVPFADGEAVAGAWPEARLVPTRGLGHFRILRDAGVVSEALEFVSVHRRWSAA